MNKHKLHHVLVKLRPYGVRYFVIVTLILAFGSAWALRQNNLQALELRDKLGQVDRRGGDVEAALRDLRVFTYAHMNTQLSNPSGVYPPIQLPHTYRRLVAAETVRADRANQALYNQGLASCERQLGVDAPGRTRCVEQYMAARRSQLIRPRHISPEVYQFDFASPLWSPDLAGFMLVLLGVSLIVLTTRLIGGWWLRHTLAD